MYTKAQQSICPKNPTTLLQCATEIVANKTANRDSQSSANGAVRVGLISVHPDYNNTLHQDWRSVKKLMLSLELSVCTYNFCINHCYLYYKDGLHRDTCPICGASRYEPQTGHRNKKMGRRKLEIKRIEDKSARQVTFSKRRKGLLKKANELSVLCDVEIAAIVFSNGGNLYQYCSTNSLPEILRRYQRSVETEPSASTDVSEKQDECSKFAGSHTTAELLKIVERELEVPLVDPLTINDLQNLEDQLEGAIIHTRSVKMSLLQESLSKLQEQEKSLVAEKKNLEEEASGNMRPAEERTCGVIDLNVANNQIVLNVIGKNRFDLNLRSGSQTP